MYLGNIILNKGKISTFPFIKVESDFNRPDSVDIPTLIVGKSAAQTYFPDTQLKMLDRKIKDNVFWCFSKLEKRDDFETNIKLFEETILDSSIKNQKYYFINIITKGYNTVKKCLKLIQNSQKKFYFVTDKHIFLYYPFKNITIGFSLSDIEYLGINKLKILGIFAKNPSNIKVEDTGFMGQRLEKAIGDKIYLIPYIYFLING